MYSNCIHCAGDLGRNEALETFPVGRRLAFDASNGRLWVVCAGCERWNLTPIEERWEAIEKAESLFRSTRCRLSTEQIGLARLRDGTELVRIGKPLRPEYAAWRYGDQFGRRRRLQFALAGGGACAATALVLAPAAIGFPVTGFGLGMGMLGRKLMVRSNARIVRLRTESFGVIVLRRKDLPRIRLLKGNDGPLAVKLGLDAGGARFEGREARRIAAALMPRVNRFGGSAAIVGAAARAIDIAGGPDGYLERLSTYAEDATYVPSRGSARRKGGLLGLTGTDRLALEMALHEEAEDRALQGELAELELAWRDAEEIAAIADDLLTPRVVTDGISRMRGL